MISTLGEFTMELVSDSVCSESWLSRAKAV